jgi:hypothetical protein
MLSYVHYYGVFWLTNLTPSCAVVTKCGNLNFLEPSKPLQACNGTALGRLLGLWEGGGPYL